MRDHHYLRPSNRFASPLWLPIAAVLGLSSASATQAETWWTTVHGHFKSHGLSATEKSIYGLRSSESRFCGLFVFSIVSETASLIRGPIEDGRLVVEVETPLRGSIVELLPGWTVISGHARVIYSGWPVALFPNKGSLVVRRVSPTYPRGSFEIYTPLSDPPAHLVAELDRHCLVAK
jgi:hypothetical protein